MKDFSTWAALATSAFLLAGCGGDAPDETASAPESIPPNKETAPPKPPPPEVWNDVLLHDTIRKGNVGYSGNGVFQIDQYGKPEAIVLANCGITNIEPLRGMPLKMLDLQGCPIVEIGAVEGMPLVEFYLDNTNVEDLSPLKGNTTLQKLYVNGTNVKDLAPVRGLPIQELNLVDSRVTDIAALAGMPLKMLWLTDLPVKDISALQSTPLLSLTIHRTQVEDLSPLANHRFLQRLHIGEAPVKDLSPLAGLQLTRLVFTPRNIEKGIEEIRKIPTMREIGTTFEDQMNTLMPPPAFWAQYDAGEFK